MIDLVVVDASLAFKWIRTERFTSEARELLVEWMRGDVQRIVPPLFAYEIANALHRNARSGTATRADLERAFDAVLRQVSVHHFDLTMLKRAMAIAAEFRLPAAYDSQYVALAETLGCELWTADERLWNAVRARFPFVRWIGAR